MRYTTQYVKQSWVRISQHKTNYHSEWSWILTKSIIMARAVFSGEANSQTNSPQEADDRPKSLQSVNSVALMVCWQYGLPIIWSAGYMICRLCLQTVWSAGYMICRLCLQTVWSVACMVCRLYDLRTVWFTECIGYSMNGLHTVWSSERMGCQL